MKRVGLLVLGMLLSVPALAQDNSRVCEKFAEHGLHNISIRVHQRALLDRVHTQYCNTRYKDMSAGLKAEVGFAIEAIPFNFGSDASTTEARYEQFCLDHRRSTDIDVSDLEVSKILYGKAVDAWENCVRLTQAEIFIDPEIGDSQTFVNVNMRYTGPTPGGLPFNGVETTSMSCTTEGRPVGAEPDGVITAVARQLHCVRAVEDTIVAGERSKYYPPASVTVKTGSDITTIEFVEMVDEPGKTKLDKLETDIATLGSKLNALKLALSKSGPEMTGIPIYNEAAIAFPEIQLPQMPDAGPKYCPDGSYVAGLKLETVPTPNCYGCVMVVHLACKMVGLP